MTRLQQFRMRMMLFLFESYVKHQFICTGARLRIRRELFVEINPRKGQL